MKKLAIYTFILICLFAALSGCKGLFQAEAAASTDGTSAQPVITESTEALVVTAESSIEAPTESTLSQQVQGDNGRMVNKEIECKNGNILLLDAIVDTTNVGTPHCYSYTFGSMTDDIRESLFLAYFGNRASEVVYDEENNLWTVCNSDRFGDSYEYSAYTGYNQLSEEYFYLRYNDVNLYPLSDNLLDSVDDVTLNLTLEDALALCNGIIGAFPNAECYAMDYVKPYGNSGRAQWYWIVYKQQLDGMPITAYQDLKFYVDENGIENIDGAIYDIGEQTDCERLLTLDEALEQLKTNAPLIPFEEGVSKITVSKITMEYLVVKDESGSPVIVPIWRFQTGADAEERNLNRETVLAVNAISGELIFERRRHTF